MLESIEREPGFESSLLLFRSLYNFALNQEKKPTKNGYGYPFIMLYVEHSSSAVERRTCNREGLGSNPLCS